MTAFHLPLPRPSAGIAAYEAELELRLATDARCAENYAAAQRAKSRRSAEVDYLPTKLDIENVSRCNFKCTMCAVSTWTKGKRAEDMTVEAFKRLIDDQHGLVEIKLNGLGEALMQGDDYFEMICYARAKHIWVRMTTNASLLHVKDNYKKLIASGVNEIDISLDGADAATFEAIRVQSDFKKVTENCKLLNDYCAEQGIVRAKSWTLVQKGNCGSAMVFGLMRIVRLAAQLGFKQHVFSLSLHDWANPQLREHNAEAAVRLRPENLHLLMEQGERYNIRVAFWDVAEKFSATNLCPWPFERAVVTSDSRTVPCCMIGDPDQFEIGKGLSFTEAWQSSEYKDFRQSHIDGRIPQVCKGCYK